MFQPFLDNAGKRSGFMRIKELGPTKSCWDPVNTSHSTIFHILGTATVLVLLGVDYIWLREGGAVPISTSF